MTSWILDDKLPDASAENGAFEFLVGVILNQNISGELAWKGVMRLSERLPLTPQTLHALQPADLEPAIRLAPAVHPFSAAMSLAIHDAAQRVCALYGGDTRDVWRTAVGVDDAASRLTQFRQIGRHKAEVAIFLLTSVYRELQPPSIPTQIDRICPSVMTYLDTQPT